MKERNEIEVQDKWDVESLYPHLEAWEEELKAFIADRHRVKTFFQKLDQGAGVLAELLYTYFELERRLTKLYTYAHLRHDEDVTKETFKETYDRISLAYFDFKNETSWIQPEILQLPEDLFASYLCHEKLKPFHIFLKKIYRLKPYTLSADKEYLLSLAEKAMETPQKAFNVFNNADLTFPSVRDEKGEEKELTHGTFQLYMQSKDRVLRKNTFFAFYQMYESYENTVCELIQGQVQKHLFEMKARGYPSCLDASLFPHQVDPAIYHNLIESVRKHILPLHHYTSFRKERLGVDKLHYYDLYVPLLPEFEKHFTFDEALQFTLDSIAPLGTAYQKSLSEGLKRKRWVDRYENARKRSGAYSSGCYDSVPYILMNFHGTLRDVMTLSHEAGHSMNSFLSNKHQPYHYSHYPIFVAEVASIFHEELLFRHLLESAESREERCYLINQKIEDIRATLFRQTLFAEFELHIHSLAEKGLPLTVGSLKSTYRDLTKEFYGPDLFIDPEVDVEFLRIPHFYYNFYVYQYATGVSAAYALVEQLLQGGEKERKKYLTFLSSGSSHFPVELLKIAGVDMTSSEPIVKLIERFDALVKELEK
jgi:oligoendopeptidase F